MRSARIYLSAVCLLATTVGCRNPNLSDFDGDGSMDTDDCEPENSQIYPGAVEDCFDGVDNDCDGDVDDADSHCQDDDDGDGEDQDGDGWTNAEGDCDDTDPAINPDQPETVCNGVNDDCDDTSADRPDLDFDTYSSCPEPAEEFDCDDTSAQVNPGLEEICGDGLDNDCDGTLNDCGWYGVHSLSDAPTRLLGYEPWGYAGTAIGGGCDLDDDGTPDLIVGAPNHNSGGMVYIVSSDVTGELSLSSADARIQSDLNDEDFGQTLDCAGDLTGDGIDDLVVGATCYTAEGDVGSYRGAVYVVPGPLSGYLDNHASAHRISGETEGDQAGRSLAYTGDITGDAIADLLVGAPYADDEAGIVYVVPGPITGDYSLGDAVGRVTSYQGAHLGQKVIDAGDVNGDGDHDALISAPPHDSAFLVHGPITDSITAQLAADLRLINGNGDAGKSLAAGDTDNNGDIELLLGCAANPWDETLGGAYLLDGTATGEVWIPNAALSEFQVPDPSEDAGSAVAVLDFNGDGSDDVFVAERSDGTAWEDAGAIYLVYAPVSGVFDLAFADGILLGDTSAGHAGNALVSLGDVDGDGTEDLLIAAYCHDPGAQTPAESGCYGAAFLILGSLGL